MPQPVPRTSDPSLVKGIVEEHGACVLDLSHEIEAPSATGTVQVKAEGAAAGAAIADAEYYPEMLVIGSEEYQESLLAAAAALPARIYGGSLLAASGPSQVPSNDYAQNNFLHSHTDGILSYGEERPDCFFFICGSASDVGGRSLFVDGYEVLEALRSDPETRWAAEMLETQSLEWSVPTEYDGHDAKGKGEPFMRSPIVTRSPTGRVAVVGAYRNNQHVPDDCEDPQRAEEMIQLWHDKVQEIEDLTPLTPLAPGEVAIVDNCACCHHPRCPLHATHVSACLVVVCPPV
jgi:hypothetical protein